MITLKRLALVAATAAFLSPLSRADEVSMRADRDNTLYDHPQGDLSNALGDWLFIGKTLRQAANRDDRRMLLHFDVAGNVPAGSTILKVELRMRVSRERGGPLTCDLHRVTADWGEGTSDATGAEGLGAPATTNDPTWLHTFYNSSMWTNAGGDFDSTVSATLDVDGNGQFFWSSDQMLADVQDMVDNPTVNFGWLMKSPEITSGNAKRFASRSHPTRTWRPRLFVEYCLPGNDASWSNYGAGWPGTNGIPSLTLSGNPVLCEDVDLQVGNSLGAATVGFLFVGLSPANLPTGWGGTLLLIPSVPPVTLPIAAGGSNFTIGVACDHNLCGVHIYAQVLEVDPGASDGVSFTPGLDMLMGH